MGKRRARCLRTMGYDDIAAVDTREDRRAEIAQQSGVQTFPTTTDALATAPEFALICLPPHLHTDCLLQCIAHGLPAFCEAPMTLTLDDTETVIQAAEKAGVFLAPSCTYLHNAIHRKVKSIIDQQKLGRLLAYLSHAGQHVADWHPYEDYRGFYASKRSQGGMCFDMLPHEFQMLTWFAGPVRALSCMARMRSATIETDPKARDVYDVTLDTASGASAVIHHDIFQRPPGVIRKLMFERGALEFNWRSLRTAEYQGPGFTHEPEWKSDPLEEYDFEQMYVDELQHALNAWRGKEDYLVPPARERLMLDLILKCEESSLRGVHLQTEL